MYRSQSVRCHKFGLEYFLFDFMISYGVYKHMCSKGENILIFLFNLVIKLSTRF